MEIADHLGLKKVDSCHFEGYFKIFGKFLKLRLYTKDEKKIAVKVYYNKKSEEVAEKIGT